MTLLISGIPEAQRNTGIIHAINTKIPVHQNWTHNKYMAKRIWTHTIYNTKNILDNSVNRVK